MVPSLRRSLHPLHDMRAYMDLRRVLREFRPQVVHTHSAKAGILGRAAAWSLDIQPLSIRFTVLPFTPFNHGGRETFIGCAKHGPRVDVTP